MGGFCYEAFTSIPACWVYYCGLLLRLQCYYYLGFFSLLVIRHKVGILQRLKIWLNTRQLLKAKNAKCIFFCFVLFFSKDWFVLNMVYTCPILNRTTLASGCIQNVLLKDGIVKDTRVLGGTMFIPMFDMIIKWPRSYSKHIRFDPFLTYSYLCYGSPSDIWKVLIPPLCLFDGEVQQRTI